MKNIPIGILILMFVGAFFAQNLDAKHGHGYHKKMTVEQKMEKMSKKLRLMEDQKIKILPIIEEKFRKMEELHNQMVDLAKEADSQISSVLTEDQRKKYEKIISRHHR